MSCIKSQWKQKDIWNVLFFRMPGLLLLHKTEIEKIRDLLTLRDRCGCQLNLMRRYHYSACAIPQSRSFRLSQLSFTAHVDVAPFWLWIPFSSSIQYVKWTYTFDVRRTWPQTAEWMRRSWPRLWQEWASNPEVFLPPRWDFALFIFCNLEVVQMWRALVLCVA